LDKSICAFWFYIIEYSDEFCRWIEDVDVFMEDWFLYNKAQNEKTEKNLLDLAKANFFSTEQACLE